MHFKSSFMAAIVMLLLSTQALAAESCRAVDGFDEVLKHRLIMVGEMHGSREVPAHFGELVCAALDAGLSVAVGLELFVEIQPALDAYLDSGDADAIEMLRSSWSSSHQDGRLSQAMLELVQRLARFKHRHQGRLSIYFLDARTDYNAGQMSKGQALAARIRQMADDSGADSLLTLSGNFHNRINVAPELSAAVSLSEMDPFTVSLAWQEGRIWACMSGRCGETDLPTREAGIESVAVVLNDAEAGNWHAWLEIPKVTPSPPAFESDR